MPIYSNSLNSLLILLLQDTQQVSMKSKQFEIQNVTDWPNLYSLDENRKRRDKQTQKKIDRAKTQFIIKNKLFDTDYQNFLDPQRDIYYPPKFNEPSYCKAGLHYSIPDDCVGIGLKVEPAYQNDQQWAVLYHGTKPNSLMSILREGLRAGGGQAHQGTLDPWGNKVPRGVYFSFWVNQSFTYTLPENPIVLECFVKDVYVAPGCKGYTVSNKSKVSRILLPMKKERLNPNI